VVLIFVVIFSALLAFHQEGQTERVMGSFGVSPSHACTCSPPTGPYPYRLGEARRALTTHARTCALRRTSCRTARW
jgi:hypothetical protein